MSGLKILPTKHFVEQLGERFFDLSVINLVYMELTKNTNPHKTLFEISNGGSTIIAKLDKEKGVVKLITGWVGNRQKKAF